MCAGPKSGKAPGSPGGSPPPYVPRPSPLSRAPRLNPDPGFLAPLPHSEYAAPPPPPPRTAVAPADDLAAVAIQSLSGSSLGSPGTGSFVDDAFDEDEDDDGGEDDAADRTDGDDWGAADADDDDAEDGSVGAAATGAGSKAGNRKRRRSLQSIPPPTPTSSCDGNKHKTALIERWCVRERRGARASGPCGVCTFLPT